MEGPEGGRGGGKERREEEREGEGDSVASSGSMRCLSSK